MNKAVFLDKDGTLIDDIPYNVNTDLIVLNKNSATGLRLLQQNGYLLVIITNQAGIAHGYFSMPQLEAVEAKLAEIFRNEGLTLSGFYYCPHHPDGEIAPYDIACYCRKPQPGLLFKAARDLDINLNASWMVGDILNDIEAGNRAGCRGILIDNGNETEWILDEYRQPVKKVKTIDMAAEYIISRLNDEQLAGL
jgi:D-glycero-D-manno-heptose 1,7-bisphosphate phosphatase